MPKADFYLIDKPRFRAEPWRLVCELAKRAFEGGIPVLILARTGEQAEALDEQLWEFDPDAYVPHQLAGDEDDAEAPVLIVAPGVATPDRAMVINLRDACAVGTFDSVKEVVPADEAERAGSRERWKTYKAAGFDVAKHDM
ncbi:MAG TPA: DNA polymerase III subunit chi [Xanthomonadales bacterium]|nr:DNA polymerase III subunit chi [Xanthomonadales bacterium]